MTSRLGMSQCLLIACFMALVSCGKSPAEKSANYFEQGKKHLAKHDFDRALLAFRNAVKADPTSAEPHYQAGLTFLEMGETNNAALSFQSAMQLDFKHSAAQLK